MFNENTMDADYDSGFGSVWATIGTSLLGVGQTAYTLEQQKKMAEAERAHEQTLTLAREQTKRMEIAIQQKQAELLARATEKAPASVQPATAGIMGGGFDMKKAGILTAVALVVGGGLYLLTKK